MITKLIRVATEKLTSVEDDLLVYQGGTVASAINATSTYLPCGMNKPLTVIIAPVVDSDADNSKLAGWQVSSLETLSEVSNLPAWAASTAYKLDQIVSNNDKAYICVKAHTSGSSFDPTKWKELREKTFLKINHQAAGAGKLVKVAYLILGYDLG
ncbi:MAG: hypothetical protein HPY57_13195 [Ignavibacteria bacterium]|nr:hypothetical protein [Ignavibacteria bacterium]